jgi:mycofactocin glycosyltransferase
LKGLRLNPRWGPVCACLSRGEFVPVSEIQALLGVKDEERLGFFLDELVRRGFLESRGFPSPKEFPLVSVVVPVRNRPEEIQACLRSLREQDYPKEKLEVLVVDDASTDQTAMVVSGFPVRLIRMTEQRQAPFCRNQGARNAGGEILAFIDSDCLASPEWLKELIPVFRDPSVGAVGGKVASHYDGKKLDRYEQVMSSLSMGNWPKRSAKKEPFFYVPSCNLLVRRKAFLAVGGFEEELIVGEDVDLCWRLQDQGQQVEYRPAGTVYHRHRNRLRTFCSRRFDYGTSEPLLQKRHPRRNKTFGFPLTGALFWTVLFLSLALGAWPMAVVGPLVAATDAAARRRTLQRKDVPVAFIRIQAAVLRDYLGFFYHCCAFLSRYYLAAGLLIIPMLPRLSLLVLGIQFLTGFVVYASKRPRMDLLSFQFFFLLEQLSYQLGVWWGCLKNLHFKPVAPRLVGTWTPQGTA